MWNKRMPRESCVVVIRECSRKGIVFYLIGCAMEDFINRR